MIRCIVESDILFFNMIQFFCTVFFVLLAFLGPVSSLAVPLAAAAASSAPYPWFDPTLPVSVRLDALIAVMSVTQKAQQLTGSGSAMPEFGIPRYEYCSEGSHGVARAGRATVFPAPISMACAFNMDSVQQAGAVLALEARGKYNDYAAKHAGNTTIWYGVTFWAPNISQDSNSSTNILPIHPDTASSRVWIGCLIFYYSRMYLSS